MAFMRSLTSISGRPTQSLTLLSNLFICISFLSAIHLTSAPKVSEINLIGTIVLPLLVTYGATSISTGLPFTKAVLSPMTMEISILGSVSTFTMTETCWQTSFFVAMTILPWASLPAGILLPLSVTFRRNLRFTEVKETGSTSIHLSSPITMPEISSSVSKERVNVFETSSPLLMNPKFSSDGETLRHGGAGETMRHLIIMVNSPPFEDILSSAWWLP